MRIECDVIKITGHVEVDRVAIDKALAKDKLRIVKMTDVTVNQEDLVQALLKVGGIPGNLCRKVADQILKRLVLGDQYGEVVEKSGETSSESSGGTTESTN